MTHPLRKLAIGLVRFLHLAGTAGLAAVTVCAVFGFAVPLFDALNHLQPVWFAAGLLALLLAVWLYRGGRLRATAIGLAGLSLVAISVIVVPEAISGLAARPPLPANAHGIRLMTYNVFGKNYDMEAVAAMIAEQDPDIIVLQEYFSPQRTRLHPLLSADFPYSAICTNTTKRGNLALYARLPFTFAGQNACQKDDSGRTQRIIARFETEGGKAFSVITTHLDWPIQISRFDDGDTVLDGMAQMSARQEGQFADLGSALTAIDGPLILAGDFNSTPWSYALRRFVSENGLRRHTRNLFTFPMRFFVFGWRDTLPFLPLDQVMSRGGITVHAIHTAPPMGSDHMPVVADFTVAGE